MLWTRSVVCKKCINRRQKQNILKTTATRLTKIKWPESRRERSHDLLFIKFSHFLIVIVTTHAKIHKFPSSWKTTEKGAKSSNQSTKSIDFHSGPASYDCQRAIAQVTRAFDFFPFRTMFLTSMNWQLFQFNHSSSFLQKEKKIRKLLSHHNRIQHKHNRPEK